MKSAIFTFGRFNPPTIGHMLLISSMKRIASKKGADVLVFTGTLNDKTRNPLKYKNKVSIMKKVFKGVNVVNNKKIKTVFQGLDYLDKLGYEDISMVVGSDRVSEFRTLISKYLKNYNFKSFNVISAGDRDPDADDVSGMSASKMRDAAKRGDYNAFKLGVPATMRDFEILKTFKLVQKGMGVKEFMKESWFDYDEFEKFISEVAKLDERVVSIQTRRKMAKIARRTAKKRARVRKRKEKFVKSKKQLMGKAEKAAKTLLRKKMMGNVNWAELSLAAKMQFDKRLAKKSKSLKKLAKKLYPKIKVAEKERIQKLRQKTPEQPTNTSEDISEGGKHKNTFKSRAVAKVEADWKKKKAKLDAKISEIKKKLDATPLGRAGNKLKSLEAKLAAVQKKKKDAIARGEEAKKKLTLLRSKLKEDYAKLKDRRAYLKKTVKQRTARVLARRKLEKEGKVCKGDGKDVDHKNGNPEDNSSGNLRVMSRGENRGRDNNKWRANEEHGAGEEGTDKLIKRYTGETPGQGINKKFKNKVKKLNGK